MKRKLLILTAVLLAVVLPIAALASVLTFTTTTLNGNSYTSEAIKNYKLTMVNIWAEWCGPCVNEMPALQQLYSENSDLLILGVWVGDSQTEALQTASQAGVQYPLLLPAGDLVTFAYKSQYIPATYFFDMNGKQVGEADGYIGGRNYSSWKSIIDGLMSEVSPDPEPQPEPDPDPEPQPEPQPQPEPEVPAGITLSATALTIKGVGTRSVSATLSDATDSIASAMSSNTKVANVSVSGNEIIVTSAKQKGKATVTVTTAKGAKAELSVTVKQGWALNEKKVTLVKGKTFKVKVLSIPSTVKAKAFKSDKPRVATVDAKGKVKAVGKGSATITVTLSNNKTLKLKVTVK